MAATPGFTLPNLAPPPPNADLFAEVQKLGKRVKGISLQQERPNLIAQAANEGLDELAKDAEQRAAMVAKLSQQFEARLKLSEDNTKMVWKGIEQKRR